MSSRGLWWLALATATAACGKEAPPPARPAAADSAAMARILATAAVPAVADSSASAARGVSTRTGVASPQGPLSPAAFRHDKHRGLACQRCHAAVPGHASHANAPCTSCHAPVPAAGPAPRPGDCGGCHHAAIQNHSCTACHDPQARGPIPLQVTWKLSVWNSPRERDLHFDHRWHKGQPCGACHTNRPSLVARRSCGSCHEHHQGNADCRLCHDTPPAGVHTVAAHRGCAAAGCHQDPPVTRATLSRDECLLCHPDREAHQPGRPCAQCHMPQSATRASAAGEEGGSP